MTQKSSIHYYEDGDLLIIIQDTIFRLHKIILSISSKIFQDMFAYAKPSSNENLPTIKLDENSIKPFEYLISFIYHDKNFKITWNCVEEISRLGDKYEVDIVLKAVETFLELHFVEKPLFSIILADQYRFKKVYKETSKLILDDLPKYKSKNDELFQKLSTNTRSLLLEKYLDYHLLWSELLLVSRSYKKLPCCLKNTCFVNYINNDFISIDLSQSQSTSFHYFKDFIKNFISNKSVPCRIHYNIMMELCGFFQKFERLERDKNIDSANSPPQLSKLVNKYADDDYIRAQLRRIKFFSSKFRFSPEILADDTNQMALIFNPITLRFSICYDEMKYEVVIPYHQLLGCTIKDEKTMEIRFKRECMKIFFFHQEGFPYVSSPVKLDEDPTKGKFAFCERMVVKALHASDFGFLKKIKFEMRQIENASRLKRIQNMKLSTEETRSVTRKVTTSFRKIKTKNNSNFNKSNKFDHGCEINLDWNSQNRRQKHVNGQQHQKSKVQHNEYIPNNRMNRSNEKNSIYENDNIYKKPKEPEKLYITVTFPTRKYVMFYPIDGSLYYLQMQLKNRFEKRHEWRFLWYKSSNGYWDKLINEKDWQFAINERLIEKGFIRIEIYMKP
ncbi:15818_t:CDS:2 [Rhizophagus irregularis]|nr:15818_t:CDS:2 [Rhizophagus irregularis]